MVGQSQSEHALPQSGCQVHPQHVAWFRCFGAGHWKLKDVITPKCEHLNQGLVEVQLLLKINKELSTMNTLKIPDLGNQWKNFIPKRPAFPENYFGSDTENEEEEEEEDIDNNNNNEE